MSILSIKSWAARRIAEYVINKEINKGVKKTMKEFWKSLDKWLAYLPFNGQKTNIGDLVTLLSVITLIVEKFLPGLEELAKHLPPEQAAIITALIGVLVGTVGRFHQLAKFFKKQ